MRNLLLILSIIMLSICVYGQKTIITPGDDATHYKLKIITSKRSIKEKPVLELKGNIIVLLWWDRGCHFSKEALKTFNAYYNMYNDKVSFYAVSNDSWTYITKFAEKNNYKFPFCSDVENKYFPYAGTPHIVIINSKGICLYHGPFNLSYSQLDTLISKDQLPAETQKDSEDNYKVKQFRNDFNEYSKSFDSYNQTGFKLEPHKSSLGISSGTWIGGEFKSYYGYNQPIYLIYRQGLVLKDYRIIITDSLKKKLSSTDTTNLYNVGFNLRKRNKYSSYHYRNVFRAYLDSAFGLSTRLLKRKEDAILITKIHAGTNISKTDYVWVSKIQGDTLLLKNFKAEDLVSTLNDYLPITFGNATKKQESYDFKIILNKDSIDKQHIVNQLKKQGIDSKIKTTKLTYLEFLPQNEYRPVNYFRTQTQQLIYRYGGKIGLGNSHYDYPGNIYKGDKVLDFSVGFFTQIKLNNHLALQPELNYLTSGSKGDNAKFRTHSIFTPVNVLLTTSQQKGIGLYAKIGGYYSYNFAGKVEGQNIRFNNNIEKNKFGWSWGLGLWLDDKLIIELSYNRGLSNIIKNGTVGDVKEKMWMLTRVYYF